MNDDYLQAINDVEVKREKEEFKLTQLKLEHFYYQDIDQNKNMIKSVSLELISEYNKETNKLEWYKTVTTNYYTSADKKTTKLENADEIINKLEKIDLRELKNDYYTNREPINFTHWELTYNNNFKIVGTYDQEVEELIMIDDILHFSSLKEII